MRCFYEQNFVTIQWLNKGKTPALAPDAPQARDFGQNY